MSRLLIIIISLSFQWTILVGQELPAVDLLESFMDGSIETLMEAEHINGVTVSIINKDSLYWSKGYGYADSENSIKVDPSNSLFRIGSVSKLFVWTAVMQLYEDGLINLDADLSAYIDDFEIPDNYQEPITMKHLMSHTPGFEDYYFNLFSIDSVPPASLGEELNRHMPARIRKPGVHSSYSNHGTAIAAYIVEEVSGLKWDDYVEKNIFHPLGMNRTSFRYILPQELKSLHSKGYTFNNGGYTSHNFKGIPLAPAGLACTTADDISAFMLAHLNYGKYNGYQMLDSSTVALMHSDLFTHDEDLRGFCYGFFNHSQNGYRIIGHGGATEYFFSYMKLFPIDGYGIFISTNTQGGINLISQVTDIFIDRYFPDSTEYNIDFSLEENVLERYCGDYLSNRRPMARMTKLAALTNNVINVSHNDGLLVTSESDTWFPIDSNTFQNTTSTSRLSFELDDSGNYKYLYLDSSPHTVLERVEMLDSKVFNLMILIWSVGLGILALIWWTASYFFKKRYKIRDRKVLPFISKVLVGVNTLLIIIFLISSALIVSRDFVFRPRITSDYLLFTLPFIIGILALCILYLSIMHFVRQGKWRSRFFYLCIALGMGAATGMMYYWNLIGYKF